MRKVFGVLAAAAFLAAPMSQAQAQDEADVVAYLALSWTPIGALPPVLSNALVGDQATGLSVNGRFGYYNDVVPDFLSQNSFGIGVGYGTAFGTVGVTGGMLMPDCDGCDSEFMAGAGWQHKLTTIDLGGTGLAIGADAQFGWSKIEDVTNMGLAAGIPLVLTFNSGTMNFSPFVSPAFGWGRMSAAGASESGTRFILGGGLALRSSTMPIGVDVGVQKIFIEDGGTQFGLGVNWSPR